MPTARLLGTRPRALAGAAELALEGGTVGELLAALATRAGGEMRALLFAPDSIEPAAAASQPSSGPGETLNRDARILKNGRNVLLLDGLGTALAEHDVVTVYFFGSRAYPGG